METDIFWFCFLPKCIVLFHRKFSNIFWLIVINYKLFSACVPNCFPFYFNLFWNNFGMCDYFSLLFINLVFKEIYLNQTFVFLMAKKRGCLITKAQQLEFFFLFLFILKLTMDSFVLVSIVELLFQTLFLILFFLCICAKQQVK